ncbi:hypothetical protein HQR03_09125 [Psychrobacter okhotskensis]|uniref:hypothetical protein n=1 Tax=Psychrobacter okhotskensis TaxID=212403 RepID=UPI001564148A|nr:hypothetical protein [Psychrobacter okhotskensis]NRD70694.1 hypothetical protein [Psychrobacter okhotskensis]
MQVKEHMSAKQLKKILNERKYLNPKKLKTLLRILEEKAQDITPPEIFEEAYYIFNTEEAIFYGIQGPISSLSYVFLNKNFVVNVDIRGNRSYSVTLSFHDNINKPTDEDKKEVINQLFDIVENAEVFLLEDMTRDNTTIEFVGV